METTLVLCIQAGAVLLANKKSGFGNGKLNAYGGKFTPGVEEPEAAALRELYEEVKLRGNVNNLKKVALLHFYFEGNKLFTCHVFILETWKGLPRETKEMGRPEWHHRTCLPFHRMWKGDKYWLPLVLSGQHIEASVYFNHDGSEVLDFIHEPLRI